MKLVSLDGIVVPRRAAENYIPTTVPSFCLFMSVSDSGHDDVIQTFPCISKI